MGLYEWYDCIAYRIEAHYDNKQYLEELMFSHFTKEERAEMDFKKTIQQQKKNIKPEFAERVQSQVKALPYSTFESVSPFKLKSSVKCDIAITNSSMINLTFFFPFLVSIIIL